MDAVLRPLGTVCTSVTEVVGADGATVVSPGCTTTCVEAGGGGGCGSVVTVVVVCIKASSSRVVMVDLRDETMTIATSRSQPTAYRGHAVPRGAGAGTTAIPVERKVSKKQPYWCLTASSCR